MVIAIILALIAIFFAIALFLLDGLIILRSQKTLKMKRRAPASITNFSNSVSSAPTAAQLSSARPKRAAAESASDKIKASVEFERLSETAASSSASAPRAAKASPGSVVTITSGFVSGYTPDKALYAKPIPKKDVNGFLYFSDKPNFRPNLTPAEILQSGAFGGGYFRTIRSGVTGLTYIDAWKEFPAEWVAGLNIKKQLASPNYNPSVNKHGVKCGQDLNAWESSGWIVAQDPFGWFHWYCRFYLGRRSEDDDRQISRWVGIAGPNGR